MMKGYLLHSIPLATLLILVVHAEVRTQTIETLPLERTTICAKDSITVRFRAAGEGWQTFNEFVLEMSTPDGAFGSGTRKIGRISSISPAEIEEIGARVPDDLDPEGRYRFRVSATRPSVAGTDNGQDVRVVPLAIAEFGLPGYVWITGKELEIASFTSGATRVEWDFGVGAEPATSSQVDPPPIRFHTPGNKRITLTAFNEAGCPNVRALQIDVFENHPRIPANTSIRENLDADTLKDQTLTPHLWICPDRTLTFNHRLNVPDPLTLYVEPGGSALIERTAVSIIAYVKQGGRLRIAGAPGSTTWIIYEQGASVEIDRVINTFHVEADTIIFDYSEAPANGCRPSSGVVEAGLPEGADRSDGSLVRVTLDSDGDRLEGEAADAGTRITDVSLYDIRGRRIITQEFGTGRFTLPLPDLRPGPYLVVLNSTAGIIHRRIILPH